MKTSEQPIISKYRSGKAFSIPKCASLRLQYDCRKTFLRPIANLVSMFQLSFQDSKPIKIYGNFRSRH